MSNRCMVDGRTAGRLADTGPEKELRTTGTPKAELGRSGPQKIEEMPIETLQKSY